MRIIVTYVWLFVHKNQEKLRISNKGFRSLKESQEEKLGSQEYRKGSEPVCSWFPDFLRGLFLTSTFNIPHSMFENRLYDGVSRIFEIVPITSASGTVVSSRKARFLIFQIFCSNSSGPAMRAILKPRRSANCSC